MRGGDGISGTNYWSINSAILSLFVRGEFPSWAIRVYDNTAWYFAVSASADIRNSARMNIAPFNMEAVQ